MTSGVRHRAGVPVLCRPGPIRPSAGCSRSDPPAGGGSAAITSGTWHQWAMAPFRAVRCCSTAENRSRTAVGLPAEEPFSTCALPSQDPLGWALSLALRGSSYGRRRSPDYDAPRVAARPWVSGVVMQFVVRAPRPTWSILRRSSAPDWRRLAPNGPGGHGTGSPNIWRPVCGGAASVMRSGRLR
jgi:hypothetical protein